MCGGFIFCRAQLVADDGIEATDWEKKAQALREAREGGKFSADTVKARWLTMVRCVTAACRESIATSPDVSFVYFCSLLCGATALLKAPRVKAELKRQDEVRACGHT